MPTIKPGAVVFQVKVTIVGIEPAIWRRFLLPGNTKLEQVHECIQGAFGWQNCHLHEFHIAGTRYGDSDTADGAPLINERGGMSRSNEYQQTNFTDYKWGASEWSMLISTPERAILELIDELPTHESFHQADVLMEGLSNLRPNYLNTVLADCRSIKTKRLFLWFAKRHNHAWLKTLDTENINLGKGKRMIVPGGKLDPKYLITVPEEFANDRQRTI